MARQEWCLLKSIRQEGDRAQLSSGLEEETW